MAYFYVSKDTVNYLGKRIIIAMLVIVPIMVAYSFYQDSEYGMIKKAHNLYNRPNKSVDGYADYINHFPNGKYSEEAKQSIADHYSSIKDFFNMNVRSRNLNRVNEKLQAEIAMRILERPHNSFDSIDYQIYYVENMDKAFWEESDIKNLSKSRKYKIVERHDYHQ